MKRALKIRGKSVELTSLDGIVAMRRRTGGVRGASAGPVLEALAPSLTAGVGLPNAEGAATFAQAGWQFGQKQEGLVQAARSGSPVPGVGAVREVAVTRSGRMVMTGDMLVVRLRAGLDAVQSIQCLAAHQLSPVRALPFPSTYEVRTTEAESAIAAAIRLSDLADFDFAEPVFDEAIGHRWRPTDPDYAQQWQWRNTGGGGGLADADARIEAAWDVTRGRRTDGSTVRVAVIDNGMDVTHPDLRAAIVHGGWFQDDGAGSTSFAAWTAGAPFPDVDHGTFCAGMAIARASNERHGCGAAPEAAFIPVACMPDQIGTQATLARALVYAALPSLEEPGRPDAEGADVIACSLGPNGGDWEMTSVLELAIDRVVRDGRSGLGTPIFWAVSNGNFPIALDEVVSHPSVVRVGRSSRLDLSDGSAFGPELDFLAPGVAVVSSRSGGTFGANTGTSFAAPLAAGIGALVLAQRPALRWNEVRDRMRQACDKVGPHEYPGGRNDQYGFGRVNAQRSI
jgi:thermitase